MVLFPVSNTLSVAGCNMTKLYYTILHNAPRSVSLINQSSFPPHWAIFVTNRHNQKTHVFHLTHFCFMKINCTVYPPVLCGFIDKYPVKSDFDKLWAYIKTSSFFFLKSCIFDDGWFGCICKKAHCTSSFPYNSQELHFFESITHNFTLKITKESVWISN